MEEKRNWNPMLFIARKIAKYLPANNVRMILVISFLMILFMFLILVASNPKAWKLMLMVSGGFYLIVTSWLLISEVRGVKRHKTILEGKTLSPLRELGFVIENIEEYWGYSGVIENYYLKIYYDWSQRDYRLCIMLYFISPKTNKGKMDVLFMRDLHEKYQTGIFSPNKYKINFQANYFQLYVPFTFSTNYNDVKTWIDFAIRTATKEKLEPINENEIKNLIQKTPWIYGPTVTTFTKTWMEKIKPQ
jgi:hypothetical protein